MGIFKRKANLVVVNVAASDKDMTWLGEGSTYYWVRSDIGQICKSKWDSKIPHHHFRMSIGNVFRTRRLAEQAIARQKELVKNDFGGKE